MKLPLCSSIAKTLALGTLTAFVMIAAKPDRASAAIFTVGGTSYDIVTATGSFNTLQSQIEATPLYLKRGGRSSNPLVNKDRSVA